MRTNHNPAGPADTTPQGSSRTGPPEQSGTTVEGPRVLLTTREVATMLGVCPATVLRRWRSGQLDGYRLASNCLRFDQHDIDAYLASMRRDGRSREEHATGPHGDRPAPLLSAPPPTTSRQEDQRAR